MDLDVAPREIVTLIGPNGAGKSTTVKMALGILAPDEGSAERKASLRVGYVPQKFAIDRTLPLTVERFMRLTQRLTGDEIAEALARTGVSHLSRTQAGNLSGGEFQRVALARAIARKPDLLVLDEPVQGVDLGGEVALYELIQAIRTEIGCAVLLVSHDLHLVMAATDRVLCLNGHVCCHGAPRAVAAMPEYRSLFGARAAEALAVYEHDHDHVHLPDGQIAYGNEEQAPAAAHGGVDACGHDHRRGVHTLSHEPGAPAHAHAHGTGATGETRVGAREETGHAR
ncbi:ATP-binding cassette domain-containing protein [Fulvimarina sp. 2208YS6-2-32]|uniref:ATP-binding cassette domain-containing protein n=1 Tax=Fulvimarina uroteuthidis TaxID=3098149 RepID=A0ABU5HWT7_9HYPH|nr:ATP-binding cassette domain-containing protein [Fulvimarina sp. 2208YS6-2-32]MDY8107599.1 ATP-binding cassette domain-containing protein [Fulvimarina sp. 2208YS6-2-32]